MCGQGATAKRPCRESPPVIIIKEETMLESDNCLETLLTEDLCDANDGEDLAEQAQLPRGISYVVFSISFLEISIGNFLM